MAHLPWLWFGMSIFPGVFQVRYLVLFLHPVFDQSSSLNKLCNFISQVACKEKPVPWLHFVGKSHESQGVTTQCKCHSATDDFWRFLHVINSSNRKSPVGYWPPKVRAVRVGHRCLSNSTWKTKRNISFLHNPRRKKFTTNKEKIVYFSSINLC